MRRSCRRTTHSARTASTTGHGFRDRDHAPNPGFRAQLRGSRPFASAGGANAASAPGDAASAYGHAGDADETPADAPLHPRGARSHPRGSRSTLCRAPWTPCGSPLSPAASQAPRPSKTDCLRSTPKPLMVVDVSTSIDSVFTSVANVSASVDDEAPSSVVFYDDLSRPELKSRLRLIGSMVSSAPSTTRSIPAKQTPGCDL